MTSEHDDLSDPEFDALMQHLDATTSDVYVSVSKAAQPVVRSEDLGRGVRIDYDEHDGVIGIEVVDCEGLEVDGRPIEVGRKSPMSRWRQVWVALTRTSSAFSPQQPVRRGDAP